MGAEDSAPGYVLGHSEGELGRLERQARIFAEATEDILRRAGLKPGMRVLDVGCGVGDVSMIAARIVGPGGSVLGVDRAGEALRLASLRAEASGYGWAKFLQADFTTEKFDQKFDALIGRFILLHLPDRSGAIRKLTEALVPGGIVAFIEMDINASVTIPELPLFERCKGWIVDLYNKVGVEPDMGSKLYATFRAAGLTPLMSSTARIESGPDSLAYDFLADTIGTLLPGMVQLGVATAEEVQVATLADRVRREIVAGDHCFIFPRFIGAWARVL
jgi:ubiquinone/menaquinone biosynthesis C-methylase UbiE